MATFSSLANEASDSQAFRTSAISRTVLVISGGARDVESERIPAASTIAARLSTSTAIFSRSMR